MTLQSVNKIFSDPEMLRKVYSSLVVTMEKLHDVSMANQDLVERVTKLEKELAQSKKLEGIYMQHFMELYVAYEKVRAEHSKCQRPEN